MTAEKIPTAQASFRIPYAAMDVYVDPATGKTHAGDALDDNARKQFKRNKVMSQERYDAWLAGFKQAAMSAMPSFKDVDLRPRPNERVILESKLFRISVESENWCFAIRLSALPNIRSRGPQAALFPKFCKTLRDLLLSCGPSACAVAKRNQASFVPVSELSDEDLDAMAKAASMRFSARRGSVSGFNEPERPKKPRSGKNAAGNAVKADDQGGNP